ncbi:MAG: response regulator transcription factor [Desulfobulbaceae bacterium]|uniref:Response regulator transcription factor n=1 Tax=Candidatus Desulfatifera sulfidica TaxID=2841691 RepID=A0A8J6N6I4_9BACT|nr:response regulator transcription factor [Candidatus Desulfatifera sulfidica]
MNSNQARILVVEDEADIQQLITYNLIRARFQVSCADSGEEALDFLANQPFDCVLLDLMLPGKSGLETCRAIRAMPELTRLPIIMLTAKGEEQDIVQGLEAGADDYITKPFSPKILLARIHSLLRRSGATAKEAASDEILSHHELHLDQMRHQLLVDGVAVELTATEFAILQHLMRRPGWVFSRQQIIDNVRGLDYSITPRAVDVQIFGLRKKLGEAGKLIETVRGIGYRLQE